MSVDPHLPVWDSVLQDSLSMFSRTRLKSSKRGVLGPQRALPIGTTLPPSRLFSPSFLGATLVSFLCILPSAGRLLSSAIPVLVSLCSHETHPLSSTSGKDFWGKRPSVHEQLAFATLRTRSELTRVTEPPTGSASVDG